MARREDTVKDDSYSSTVRKVMVTNSGKEVTSDNPLTVDSYQETEQFDNLDRKDLLEEILRELKKINLHLYTMTNEKITEDDIECQ